MCNICLPHLYLLWSILYFFCYYHFQYICISTAHSQTSFGHISLVAYPITIMLQADHIQLPFYAHTHMKTHACTCPQTHIIASYETFEVNSISKCCNRQNLCLIWDIIKDSCAHNYCVPLDLCHTFSIYYFILDIIIVIFARSVCFLHNIKYYIHSTPIYVLQFFLLFVGTVNRLNHKW